MKKEEDKKIFGMISFVLAVVIIVTSGSTFAYYSTNGNNGSTISGTAASFDVTMSIDEIHKATQLIPMKDNLVSSAISKSSNKCVDKDGYDACSLYKITLKNTGEAQVLNGYITTSTSDYETDNLKYQVYDDSFNVITDAAVLSRVVDTKSEFKKNSNNVSLSINKTDLVYYLVIWLSDTGTSQNADYDKSFTGVVGFNSPSGGKLTAYFSS